LCKNTTSNWVNSELGNSSWSFILISTLVKSYVVRAFLPRWYSDASL
jgi:hypothetical protein